MKNLPPLALTLCFFATSCDQRNSSTLDSQIDQVLLESFEKSYDEHKRFFENEGVIIVDYLVAKDGIKDVNINQDNTKGSLLQQATVIQIVRDLDTSNFDLQKLDEPIRLQTVFRYPPETK